MGRYCRHSSSSSLHVQQYKMKSIPTLVVLIVCTFHGITCDDETLVVTTLGKVTGTIETTIANNKTFNAYRGIRYAESPTGTLRFKAPEPAKSWDDVYAATSHGNICPQYNPITDVYTSSSEDCLFLNVYSPNITTTTAYPVLFFIHGGANMFGSGDDDLYGPDYFIEQDIIVVTFNYRLGPLGFLDLGCEDVPGNAALKDQALALKWVYDNIASFGGDNSCITILGDTAGAASATLHMLSSMSKGLFKKVVAMSGAPTADYALTYQPERKAQQLGKKLNCTNDGNQTTLLSCLQDVSHDYLFSVNPTVIASENITNVLFKRGTWAPVVERNTEKPFIAEDPITLTPSSGNFNLDIDVMMGYAGKEALLLAPLYNTTYISLFDWYRDSFATTEIQNQCTPDQVLCAGNAVKEFFFGEKPVNVDNMELFLDYASNASIAIHVQRFVNKWVSISQGKTYFFKVNYFTDWNVYGQQGTPYNISDSSHFDWVFYLFYPKSMNFTVDITSSPYTQALTLVTSVANFIKEGDPSVDGVTIPQYDITNKTYVSYKNDGPEVSTKPDEASYNFFEYLYGLYGICF